MDTKKDKHIIIRKSVIILSLILSSTISVAALAVTDIVVTSTRVSTSGTLDAFQLEWLSEGRLINTLERDIEIMDDARELCERKAKRNALKCQIFVLEMVVDEGHHCSNLLHGKQKTAELKLGWTPIGGSITITGSTPQQRNESCLVQLNRQKELELKYCELEYESFIDTNCNF